MSDDYEKKIQIHGESVYRIKELLQNLYTKYKILDKPFNHPDLPIGHKSIYDIAGDLL